MFSSTGYQGFSNPETFTLYEYINENPNLKEVIDHSIKDFFYNCADDSPDLEDNTLIQQRIQDIVSRVLTGADVIAFLDLECKKKVPVNYNMSPLETSFFQMAWMRINWDDISEQFIQHSLSA